MDEHDLAIIEHFRSAILLLSQRYREKLIYFCQQLLRSNDVFLAQEFAIQTFLEVPKRLDLDRYKGKDLRYLIFPIASELCEAHNRSVLFGIRMTKKARLSSMECAVLFLREMEGFTFKEIGEMLNIKPNTVQKQYRQAVKKAPVLQEPKSGERDA